MDNISRIDTYLSFALSREGYTFFTKIRHSFSSEKLFEDFLKDWLTIRNDGKIPSGEALSSDFMLYFQEISQLRSESEVLTELAKYAKYFLKLTVADVEFAAAREKIKHINFVMARDSYPFLMEVMDDLECGRIDEEMFEAILNTVLSFVLERESGQMSPLASNFADLSSKVNKMLALRAYSPKIINEEDGGAGYDRVFG